MKNYYQILGIEETASKEQVRKAYKQLSLKYHPDKNNGEHYFSELFQNINEANQVLSNDLKRAEYDFLLKDYFDQTKKWPQYFSYEKKEKGFLKRQIHTSSLLAKAGWFTAMVGLIITIVLFFAQDDFSAVDEMPKEVEIIPLTSVKEEPLRAVKAKKAVKEESSLNQNVKKELGSKKFVKKQLRTRDNDMQKMYAFVQKHKKQSKIARQKTVVIQKKPVLPVSLIARQTSTKKAAPGKKPPGKGLVKQKAIIKTPIEKVFTEEQMVTVFNQITSKKRELGTGTKCVKIFKTNSSNLKNAFSIATFLRKKGYTIAGREKINDDLKGINIAATNNCITITIGIL